MEAYTRAKHALKRAGILKRLHTHETVKYYSIPYARSTFYKLSHCTSYLENI